MFGKSKSAQELTVSNRTIIRVIALVVGSVIVLNLVKELRHPLTLIFVSFFLALAINPAVTWVSRKLRSQSRKRATAIAYFAVITLLIAMLSLIVPPFVRQTTKFVDNAPNTLRELENSEGVIGETIRNYELGQQIENFANSWAENLDTAPIVTTANRVVSNVFSVITVLILTFMILIEGPKWLAFMWRQFPEHRREHAKDISRRMYEVVTNYVNGQVIVAGIGAFFATIALFITTTLFDVSSINPIALGGLVFMFNLVPYIGVFISTALVVLFSLFASVPMAIAMLVFFIVYQQIENASIQPYVQSKGLEMTPLLVFTAALLGVSLAGILGALIAIPTAGCLRILVEDYLERNTSYQSTRKRT